MLDHDHCLKKLREIRSLKDRKDALQNELKGVNAEIEEIESLVADYFINNGIKNIDLDGNKYILYSDAKPNITDAETLRSWLDSKGELQSLLMFSAQKFKAYYKSKIENNEELPPGVEQFIVNEIRMRKG